MWLAWGETERAHHSRVGRCLHGGVTDPCWSAVVPSCRQDSGALCQGRGATREIEGAADPSWDGLLLQNRLSVPAFH